MKKIFFTTVLYWAVLQAIAQPETSDNKSDTVKAGNFIIIKKKTDKGKTKKSGFTISINNTKDKHNENISTNWFVLDLGFANYRDETNYTSAQSGNYLRTLYTPAGAVNNQSLRLKTGKSSNVNLWFFMQRVNLSQHVFNLKYGLGLEMYNFRFDRNVSYRKDPNPFIFNDTINFSKNKLYAGYITIPLMLNINTKPGVSRSLSFSAGLSAGYLISTRNKQVSDIRGKIKYKGDFDLQPFRLAAVGEIGVGPVRLYASYSLNALHNKATMLEQYPYAIGLRLSSW